MFNRKNLGVNFALFVLMNFALFIAGLFVFQESFIRFLP